MNMKNTVILLIFLLSIVGLIIGIHYTENIDSANSHDLHWKRIYEDKDGVLTVTLEKKHDHISKNYLT